MCKSVYMATVNRAYYVFTFGLRLIESWTVEANDVVSLSNSTILGIDVCVGIVISALRYE